MHRVWLALQVFGLVSAWFSSAAADGEVTPDELAQLVNELGKMLGKPIRLRVTT